MNVFRVNMSILTTAFEEIKESDRIVGGRVLTAGILNKEMPPGANPLGKIDNYKMNLS